MTERINPPIMVYTTFPTNEIAEDVGGALVDKKLAACVNILPTMISIYEWEGKMERSNEVVMLIKTSKSIEERVIEEVTRLHPYDTPAILVIDLSGGNNAYLKWIGDQTAQ